MYLLSRLSAAGVTVASCCAISAHAQDVEAAVIQQELATMRAQMERMAQRIDMLERELAAAPAVAVETPETPLRGGKASAHKPAVAVTWKGAPELEGEGGWSFKPRGRLQFDAGFVASPDAAGRADGFGSEMRRARLGVEGGLPGGFGYRFEADLAGDEVEVADAWLTYQDGGLTLTVGQHNPFQGLEELTSSRFTSYMERAAFTDAFGFERRLGLSVQYGAGDLLVQGGLFSDNISHLSNKSWSMDGRFVFMPVIRGVQLHMAGSVHFSELNDAADAVRYRQRPFIHFTNERFIDTGSVSATSELGFGLESAAIAGPFHAAAEGYWQRVSRPGGLPEPTFFGGYAEVGYFLTRGDRRGYRKGIFDRVKPASPVGEGGIGAIQINLRYDHLDLTDASIVGGRQSGFAVSLIWTPTDYTRFMVNYGRMQYGEQLRPVAGGDSDYGVHAFGMRAQIDF